MTEQEYIRMLKEFSTCYRGMKQIAEKIKSEGGWAFPSAVFLDGIPESYVSLIANEDKFYDWQMPEISKNYREEEANYTATGKWFELDGVKYRAQFHYEKKEKVLQEGE